MREYVCVCVCVCVCVSSVYKRNLEREINTIGEDGAFCLVCGGREAG